MVALLRGGRPPSPRKSLTLILPPATVPRSNFA